MIYSTGNKNSVQQLIIIFFPPRTLYGQLRRKGERICISSSCDNKYSSRRKYYRDEKHAHWSITYMMRHDTCITNTLVQKIQIQSYIYLFSLIRKHSILKLTCPQWAYFFQSYVNKSSGCDFFRAMSTNKFLTEVKKKR